MQRCKAYKGLESSCKIHGLNSQYFYLMFTGLMIGGIITIIGIIPLVRAGSILGIMMVILFVFLVLIGFYRFFYKRSNQPKIQRIPVELTISNCELFNTLKCK